MACAASPINSTPGGTTGESSGAGAEVEKVYLATGIVHDKRPDPLVEGPIQYDPAIDPEVGATKLPHSQVAARATVLNFPDLNIGNNTYQAVQRSANAVAIGCEWSNYWHGLVAWIPAVVATPARSEELQCRQWHLVHETIYQPSTCRHPVKFAAN